MPGISGIVRTTTKELTPATTRIPVLAWGAFSVFNKVHGVWWWWRAGKRYSDPNSFTKLAAGHALDFAVGDKLPIRLAAHAIFIVTRIVECVEAKQSFYHACRKWVSTVRGDYPLRSRVKWEGASSGGFFSSSTFIWLKGSFQILIIRIKRIALATLNLGKQGFQLSMHLMDARAAFSMSPTVRHEAVSRVFDDGAKLLDTLSENRQELLDKLKSNKAIIDKVLSFCPLTADGLISHVESTLKKADQVNKVATRVGSFAGEFLKKAAFGLASLSGVTRFVKLPKLIVPKADTSKVELVKRYPSTEWMTRKADQDLKGYTAQDVQDSMYAGGVKVASQPQAKGKVKGTVPFEEVFQRHMKSNTSKKKNGPIQFGGDIASASAVQKEKEQPIVFPHRVRSISVEV